MPPDDQVESSFGAANEAFFRPLGIAADKIHRVLGEQTPEQGAAQANAEIKRIVPLNAAGQPVLDLIFWTGRRRSAWHRCSRRKRNGAGESSGVSRHH